MKKIMICLVAIFVFTITLYNIRCEEVLVRIKTIKPIKTTGYDNKQNNNKINENVRIVIMDNQYDSIYHSLILFKSEELKIYYGKNYRKQKTCKNIKLNNNRKFFDESNVIKVEAKENIKWINLSRGNINPIYKGKFYIYKTEKGLVAVNEISIDNYVAAVISSEIGEENPMEALKAQAVCARTYIKQLDGKKYKIYNANADDSTNFQVYNRVNPGEKCIRASQDTRNVVMMHNNKLIKAYYFSTSCGYTTDFKIWNEKKLGYLKGCCVLKEEKKKINMEKKFDQFIKNKPKAFEDKYPFYRWNTYLTIQQIENSLYEVTDVAVKNIKKIDVNSRGVGGIVSEITIYGKDKKIVLTNQNQIRKVLISNYADIYLNDGSVRNGMEMLPSAFIHIENVYNDGRLCGIKIYGGGFGHGSGMSQNGAIELAKSGLNYKQILNHFYKDINICYY